MDNIDEKLNNLIGKTIHFNKRVLSTELDYSPNQMTKVTNAYKDNHPDCFIIESDFSEFAEYNKQFAEHNYYNKDGDPKLAFHQTSSYPKDGKLRDYYDINELINNKLPFDIIIG